MTGACHGISAAISAELACEGAHLCPAIRDPAMLQDAASHVTNTSSVRTMIHPSDLRAPEAAGDASIRTFGRLDSRLAKRCDIDGGAARAL